MHPSNIDELRNLTLEKSVVVVRDNDSKTDDASIAYTGSTGAKPFLLSFGQNSHVRSGSILEDGGAYHQFFALDDIVNSVSLGTSSSPEEVKSTFGYFLLLYSLGVARAESMASSHLVLSPDILPAGISDFIKFANALQNLTNEGTNIDTDITLYLLPAKTPQAVHTKKGLTSDKVVTLISGGTDSVGVSFIEQRLGKSVLPVQVIYDQAARHQELWCVGRVAEDLGIKANDLCRVYLPMLKNFGASGLLRDDVAITEHNTKIEYVPFRNTVLLAIAMIRAELTGSKYIAIGANHDDTLAPDGTPAYIGAINRVIQVVDGQNHSVIAPLLGFGGKPEIIRTGLDLGVDFSHIWSCHAYTPPEEAGPNAKACGTCGNCSTRYSAFELLGLRDPVRYKEIPRIRTKWAGPQRNYESLRSALGIKR